MNAAGPWVLRHFFQAGQDLLRPDHGEVVPVGGVRRPRLIFVTPMSMPRAVRSAVRCPSAASSLPAFPAGFAVPHASSACALTSRRTLIVHLSVSGTASMSGAMDTDKCCRHQQHEGRRLDGQ
jgi:hypothetical protein